MEPVSRRRSLIVHAWLEDDHGIVLRARITEVPQEPDDEPGLATTASNVEALCAAVESWAGRLVAG